MVERETEEQKRKRLGNTGAPTSGGLEGARAGADQEAQLSPEGAELITWLSGRARSVQEVRERVRLSPPQAREEATRYLQNAPMYGAIFVSSLAAAALRDRMPLSQVRADSLNRRVEAPEGFQPILGSVSALRSQGRKVVALTPELIPDSLIRIWPPGRPLPEMILINLDLAVPRVAVVSRMRGGAAPLDRSILESMTTTVRQVLGNPNTLREVASAQGVQLEKTVKQVRVEATPVLWSPTLELGDLLYDRNLGGTRREQSPEERQHGELSAAHERLTTQRKSLDDLDQRLLTLSEGWEGHQGRSQEEAQERLEALRARHDQTLAEVDVLDEEHAQLTGRLEEGQTEGADQRLAELTQKVQALDATLQRLSEDLVQEEKALREFVKEQERRQKAQAGPQLATPTEEPTKAPREKAMAEREDEQEAEVAPTGARETPTRGRRVKV